MLTLCSRRPIAQYRMRWTHSSGTLTRISGRKMGGSVAQTSLAEANATLQSMRRSFNPRTRFANSSNEETWRSPGLMGARWLTGFPAMRITWIRRLLHGWCGARTTVVRLCFGEKRPRDFRRAYTTRWLNRLGDVLGATTMRPSRADLASQLPAAPRRDRRRRHQLAPAIRAREVAYALRGKFRTCAVDPAQSGYGKAEPLKIRPPGREKETPHLAMREVPSARFRPVAPRGPRTLCDGSEALGGVRS